MALGPEREAESDLKVVVTIRPAKECVSHAGWPSIKPRQLKRSHGPGINMAQQWRSPTCPPTPPPPHPPTNPWSRRVNRLKGERLRAEAAGYANEPGLRQEGVNGVAPLWREQKVNYINKSLELWTNSFLLSAFHFSRLSVTRCSQAPYSGWRKRVDLNKKRHSVLIGLMLNTFLDRDSSRAALHDYLSKKASFDLHKTP